MDHTDGSKSAPRTEGYTSPPMSEGYGSPPQHSEGFGSPQPSEGYGSPRQEGYWDPSERHGMSVAGSSPRAVQPEPYYVVPPVPQKETPYYEIQSPGGYSAPEVVGPFAPYPPHENRPVSPYSGGGSTLISPTIPPFSLNDKDAVSRPTSAPPPEEPKKCGIKKRWFKFIFILLVVWVVIVGLALGLGLGLGLKKKHSSPTKVDPFCRDHPDLCIGGYLDEEFYSKSGAFNGSGIALAGESWNHEEHKIFTVYFQHWTGDIRFMQYTADGQWIGGGKSETVATDAKNGTAISTVAYSMNATQVWHVFYIDKNNTIRQKTQTNVTNIWESGFLNKANLKTMDSPSVGLQACWKGNYYGDSDFTHFPTPSGETNDVPFGSDRGMNIWFAIDEFTFTQWAWYEGQDHWVELKKWQGMNGHAGVGCYSWGEGTTTYTMMVNRDNDMEIWWKDTNTNLTSEDEHPINSWVNSTNGAINDVHPASSLGYTTYLYAQMADRTIKGYNITYQAENTTMVPADTLTVSGPGGAVKGLGGTHLTVTAVSFGDNGNSLYIFYQTNGSDISVFTRGINGGQWSQGAVPIPDD
ncbi:hypothetical protein K469DRAFT_710168 [Zopfia rhizophila CBS 207.26]|uniref:Fucose-specific lectin n=1 Tax=Zopfia rhizophila CBS 207.26 TaxID=1314779 RepID=A0A6A6DW44_9PEZI|nr:hypothetical protein K469DRAFT_710168 [Zopfia rhizophila CBS 207.26]